MASFFSSPVASFPLSNPLVAGPDLAFSWKGTCPQLLSRVLLPKKKNSYDRMNTLFNENYTVLDLETSGGKPEQNGILEIGLVKICKGNLTKWFSTLVNPQRPIHPFVKEMTGITEEMVADAPLFGEISGFVYDFLDCDILVLHNSPFDLQVLNYHYEKLDMARAANPILCTVKLGERLFPEAPNRRLETLAGCLQIPMNARHRAPCDAEATAKIFLECLTRLQKENITTLAQLCRWLWVPPQKA